ASVWRGNGGSDRDGPEPARGGREPIMNRIAPYPLWIGHEREGHDFTGLFDQGIAALVDLAYEEAPRATPRELISCRFPLIDGAPRLWAELLDALPRAARLGGDGRETR